MVVAERLTYRVVQGPLLSPYRTDPRKEITTLRCVKESYKHSEEYHDQIIKINKNKMSELIKLCL